MNNKRWDWDMVGILADEYTFYQRFGRQSIFRNHLNVIQFNLLMITKPPENFPSVDYFTAFSHDLEEWGFEDFVYLNDEERAENLRSFLDDMLIVFKPERRILQDNKIVYVATNVRVIPKTEHYQASDVLIPLPIYSQRVYHYDFDELLNRLTLAKYLGRMDNISSDPGDTPPYIIWQDENDAFQLIGPFEQHHYAYGGFKFYETEPFKILPFKDEWLFQSYHHGHLLYVTEGTLTAIRDVMKGEEVALVRHLVSEKETAHQTAIHIQLVRTEADVAEKAFLDRLMTITRDQGLFYEEKDLYNFHTAMKVPGLVILSGMSGTGKSRLVQAYGKALGLSDSQIAIVPVRPSWTDDGDLLGYADTLNAVYRPGDSELVNMLLEAEKEENQDRIYIICFDEMNLARVEHYFSQFLSLLEMDRPHRVLRLYNDDLAARLQNAGQYKPTVKIGDNVLFVGTVNVDESTVHFSDKVLDRANVLELKVLPYHVLKNISGNASTAIGEGSISFGDYQKMKNPSQAFELTDEEIEFFWTLHEDLQRLSQKMGIGPRIIRQIDRYLKNIPNSGAFNRSEALDLQVVQRILTKIRGTEDMLAPYFGVKNGGAFSVETSRFIEHLDRFSHLSSFTETRRVAEQKMKELKENGYTL